MATYWERFDLLILLWLLNWVWFPVSDTNYTRLRRKYSSSIICRKLRDLNHSWKPTTPNLICMYLILLPTSREAWSSRIRKTIYLHSKCICSSHLGQKASYCTDTWYCKPSSSFFFLRRKCVLQHRQYIRVTAILLRLSFSFSFSFPVLIPINKKKTP